jgi:hypothetical protein
MEAVQVSMALTTQPPPPPETEAQRLRALATEARLRATRELATARDLEAVAARLEKEARSCGLSES